MINKRAINSPYALAVHVHTQYHDGVITGDQARSAIADGLAEQIGMDPVSVRPFIARRWEASPKSLGGYRNLLRNRDSFAGWVRAMKAALVGDVRAEKPAGLFVVLLVLALVAGCTRPELECVDASPYWEKIPWTRRQRTHPYQAGDTIYAWYWGAENPFY